jgi:UDP-glucuronate 4-epimerase
MNLWELCKDFNIKKLFVLLHQVFTETMKNPFSETDNVDNPISPYAATKKVGKF